MFDRLHERYLNTALAGMCADIQRRVAARKEERKTARAARQHQYAFYRQGRRPSMVEVL
jgi:protein-disulfide isomerase-like protein with CxxC motif